MALTTIQITGKVATPDGMLLAGGVISVELSQPGSAFDGTGTERLVGRREFVLAGGVCPSGMALVPNDLITPIGTVYKARITGVTVDGLPYRSTTPELLQLTSGPTSMDFGAIPRVGVVPGVVVGPDALTLAARDAAALSALTARAWVDGGSPSSIYGGTSPIDGGTP